MNRHTGKDANRTKVLIVEDSLMQAGLLKDILEQHGFISSVAENGKRALEMIGAFHPDAIISDVLMPVMDGYELCRTIKNDNRYRHIPVILLTMLTDTKDVIHAMESGADNFITKPYQGEYIISRLNAVLEQKNAPGFPEAAEAPFDIVVLGNTYTLRQGRRQIIEFLLSSYEAAVLQHKEVIRAQGKLAEANDEANLYLDIITHDINNVNTGSLALTELLLMKTADADKVHAMRLIASIDQSIEIIGNVSTIRKLHERKEAIHPVNLDEVIINEILHYNTAQIKYTRSVTLVMADTLIGQIFTNLIGNSVKFAGTDAEIGIAVMDNGDMVEVVVTDNGAGIPDDMKPVIFDRFRKGRSNRSGKGLGLFIARTLVEIYGGKIWAGDRVPGQWTKGAAIHFTLKKAS